MRERRSPEAAIDGARWKGGIGIRRGHGQLPPGDTPRPEDVRKGLREAVDQEGGLRWAGAAGAGLAAKGPAARRPLPVAGLLCERGAPVGPPYGRSGTASASGAPPATPVGAPA